MPRDGGKGPLELADEVQDVEEGVAVAADRGRGDEGRRATQEIKEGDRNNKGRRKDSDRVEVKSCEPLKS